MTKNIAQLYLRKEYKACKTFGIQLETKIARKKSRLSEAEDGCFFFVMFWISNVKNTVRDVKEGRGGSDEDAWEWYNGDVIFCIFLVKHTRLHAKVVDGL